ncbi:MAG: M23 family metallopeptidase, partial [Anaerolineae bacterium]|nr:M23 family metallopeptidase [Anaerolineae bacterium]
MAVSNFKWPADQSRISTPYNAATGSLEFDAPPGTPVKAITGGKVYVVGTDWLQIASEQFTVTY